MHSLREFNPFVCTLSPILLVVCYILYMMRKKDDVVGLVCIEGEKPDLFD